MSLICFHAYFFRFTHSRRVLTRKTVITDNSTHFADWITLTYIKVFWSFLTKQGILRWLITCFAFHTYDLKIEWNLLNIGLLIRTHKLLDKIFVFKCLPFVFLEVPKMLVIWSFFGNHILTWYRMLTYIYLLMDICCQCVDY